MIIYRPQRLLLDEAMAEKREFSSMKEMLEYLVKEHKKAFDIDDIFITYYAYDERISWETFIVTVSKYADEIFEHPQAIGFCTIAAEPPKMKGGE
jgi:hypothetical protein